MHKQILSTFTPDTGYSDRKQPRFIPQPPSQLQTVVQEPPPPTVCVNPASVVLAPADGTTFHTSTVVGEDGVITKIIYVEGPRGRDGVDGRDGVNGINGENGRPGLPGQDGNDGQSIRGPKGDSIKGDKGDDGIQGPRGEPGKDAPCTCKDLSGDSSKVRIIRSKGNRTLFSDDKLVVIDTSESVTLILPEIKSIDSPETSADFYHRALKIEILCYSGTHYIKPHSNESKVNKYMSNYSISAQSQNLQTKCVAISLENGNWIIV